MQSMTRFRRFTAAAALAALAASGTAVAVSTTAFADEAAATATPHRRSHLPGRHHGQPDDSQAQDPCEWRHRLHRRS